MKLFQPLSELSLHRSLAVCDGGILLILARAKVKRPFRSGELKVSFAEDGKEFCVPIQQVDYLLDSNGEAIFEQVHSRIFSTPRLLTVGGFVLFTKHEK